MFRSVAIQLTDATSVGEARRAGQRLGSELGFSEIKNGELGLIVTEAARNAVSHAGGGELVISSFRCQDALCADVLALDQGQGISDLGKAFQDGYSTPGTPGEGLGAIRRMGISHGRIFREIGDRLVRPGDGREFSGRRCAGDWRYCRAISGRNGLRRCHGMGAETRAYRHCNGRWAGPRAAGCRGPPQKPLPVFVGMLQNRRERWWPACTTR